MLPEEEKKSDFLQRVIVYGSLAGMAFFTVVIKYFQNKPHLVFGALGVASVSFVALFFALNAAQRGPSVPKPANAEDATVRYVLQASHRRYIFTVACVFGGILLFALLSSEAVRGYTPYVMVSGMGCIFYMQFRIRCPKCRSNLEKVLSRDAKVCPFCRLEFDSKVKDCKSV
jgi:hypothetical protein